VTRLRRVDCASPGLTRRRCGRGFTYLDERGRSLRDAPTLERIRGLAIPPAWQDVWICPDPNGHLQAVGTDAAGRRQYLYHSRWRARRDREKFDTMVAFARRLPALREAVDELIDAEGLTKDRVLALGVRLLDRGFFRVGGEEYAKENGSYGLATLRKEHVTLEGPDSVVFDYVGKAGKRHVQRIVDLDIHRVVRELKRRRGAGAALLAYKERRWVAVRSDEINAFIKELAGPEFSAKDFRTWHATVLAAIAVGVAATATSENARARAVRRAVAEVAHYLGNTPAVCRASYIDARIFDRYRAGETIADAIEKVAWEGGQDAPPPMHAVEGAVLGLLDR